MVRRTKEEALETRSRIIDAAEQVFYVKGVANASLEEIAAAAELTRGAIYWHFKDKAELFDAMMQCVVLPVEEMLERSGCCGRRRRRRGARASHREPGRVVLDPGSFALKRHAEALVDIYFRGLASTPLAEKPSRRCS